METDLGIRMLQHRERRMFLITQFFYFNKNIAVQTADHHGDANLQLRMTSFGSDVSHEGEKVAFRRQLQSAHKAKQSNTGSDPRDPLPLSTTGHGAA